MARRSRGARRVLPAPVWPRTRIASGFFVLGEEEDEDEDGDDDDGLEGRKGCSSVGKMDVCRMWACVAAGICQAARRASSVGSTGGLVVVVPVEAEGAVVMLGFGGEGLEG
jgi:hypothetical protein